MSEICNFLFRLFFNARHRCFPIENFCGCPTVPMGSWPRLQRTGRLNVNLSSLASASCNNTLSSSQSQTKCTSVQTGQSRSTNVSCYRVSAAATAAEHYKINTAPRGCSINQGRASVAPYACIAAGTSILSAMPPTTDLNFSDVAVPMT